MFEIFKEVIFRRRYKLDRILSKIDSATEDGDLTEEQRTELRVLIANVGMIAPTERERETLEALLAEQETEGGEEDGTSD